MGIRIDYKLCFKPVFPTPYHKFSSHCFSPCACSGSQHGPLTQTSHKSPESVADDHSFQNYHSQMIHILLILSHIHHQCFHLIQKPPEEPQPNDPHPPGPVPVVDPPPPGQGHAPWHCTVDPPQVQAQEWLYVLPS